MSPRVHFITLGVAELTRARQFYEALGFTAAGGNDEFVIFPLGPLNLALYGEAALAADAGLPLSLRSASEARTFRGMALAHNVRNREEVEPLLERAVAAGGTLLQAAHDTFWGGFAGYFADPDGHAWEVAWNPRLPLTAEGWLQELL